MAHQKLGNGQNTELETDIAVVAPRNIGKGIKWNPETEQYEINVSAPNSRTGSGLSIDGEGRTAVALSKDPTNLLQMKPDGVYYGIKPPANLENLYVDAENGVDQHPDEVEGAGTKAKPLRTITYACDIAVQGTTRNIFLKENQEHVVQSGSTRVKSGRQNFYLYGDTFEQRRSSKAEAAIVEEMGEQGLLPKVVFTGVSHWAYPTNTKQITMYNHACLYVLSGCDVYFSGCEIVNDLNFEYTKADGVVTRNANWENGNRIQTSIGSVLTFGRCVFTCRGVSTLNSAVDKYTDLTEQKGGDTLSVVGFCGTEGSISVRLSKRSDFGCYFIGHSGWGVAPTAGTSVSLSASASNPNYSDRQQVIAGFAKRIRKPTIDNQNGVKILLAPRSDVSATLFE